MIKIEIMRSAVIIQGFTVDGHAGYKEHGSDIICAAISTITQATIIGLNSIRAKMMYAIEEGYSYCNIDKEYYRDSRAQILLETFELTVKSIQEEYSNYVSVEIKGRL